ncbi:MAG: preprotein translocase subunit YajC [Lachnoclostridium sp.]|nr:preprotein translocase subunit YajC [Lachnospira sp.]MCM1248124.1 preprotein translocase subunit YajC [Lachnoclostridium sp.]MCM1536634.1 preprotein translocase subunit YajC [Clostridium sp.]
MGILLTEAEATVADAAAAGQATGSLVSVFVMFGAWIVIMYFLMIRPQKKEQKRLNTMLADLAPGDCVLTTSGFYGIVIDISDEDSTVIVEFGNNKNCRIPMEKTAISRVEKADV